MEVAAHWVWVSAGLILLITEMATMSFFLLGPGVTALFIGLLTALAPGLLPPVGQAALFAVLAAATTWAARVIMMPLRRPRPVRDALNDRVRRLMGRQTRAADDFIDGIGHIEIDGQRWRARADHDGPIMAGARVVIVDVLEGDLVVREAPRAF